LVTSLARPGGNVTGLSLQSSDLAGKRLELLRELVPARRLAIMLNIGNPNNRVEMVEVQAAAGILGIDAVTSEIRQEEDIVPAFEALKGRAEALYVCANPLMTSDRFRINTSFRWPIGSCARFAGIFRFAAAASRLLDTVVIWRQRPARRADGRNDAADDRGF
jgi:hypothetical protein